MSAMQLPSGWTTVRIKDITQILYGKALPTSSRANSGHFPVYGSGGNSGNHNAFLHNGPSIIIGRKGNVGSIYLADGPFWCIDTAFYLDNINDAVDIVFLTHALQLANLTQYTKSVAIPGISRDDIENVLIPLPPLPEQRRIAAILREADEIRKLRQEANEKTQKVAEALFYDMFGDSTSWEKTIPLEQCVNFVGGGTPDTKLKKYFQGSIPWATSKDIKGRYLYDTQDHITPEAIQHSSTKLVPENTILVVVKSKILMHSLPMSIVTQPVCFGQDLKGLVCYPEFAPQFILASLTMQKKRILDSARGVNTEGLTLELLRNIPIPQVNLDLQRNFVESIRIYDDLLLDHKENGLYLNVLYQSLLTQAFTGELTASWRDQHSQELLRAAQDMAILLKDQPIITLELKTSTLPLPSEEELEREDLADQFSPLQQALFTIFLKNKQNYFTANQLYEDHEEELQTEELQASLDQTRRELRTLATLGFIKEIALPITDRPGRVDYATVYRYPQRDDNTKSEDLELLTTRNM